MVKKRIKAIELRQLDEETICKIREWRNQDFVRKNMFHQDIITAEEHEQWIQKVRLDNNRYLFVLYIDDIPLGVCTYIYNMQDDIVEMGHYLISEEDQTMGYGVLLTYFGLDIMYNVLHYNRMRSQTLVTNKRVKGINRYLGGEEKVASITKNGKEYEIDLISGTREEWNKVDKKTLGKLVFKFVEEDYKVLK